MKCSEARPLLDPLCDGALEAKDSALVLDHLKTCDQCQHEWKDLEDLRTQFQEAKGVTQVPVGLMEKISERLKADERNDRSHALRRYALPVVAIAAGALLVGMFSITSMQHNATSTQAALADSLVEHIGSNEGLEPVVDRGALAQKVGYDLKYLRLLQWKMRKSAVYTTPDHQAIARFDFIRNSKSGEQQLSCYQAPEGSIRAANSAPESVAGKRVHFGNRGNMQYALWSQDGRDYLFVTALPLEQLREIVRES